jgi:alanyl aminopeptidase
VKQARLALPAGETLVATYAPVDEVDGVARVSLPRAVRGEATLTVAYDAPWGRLTGLYRIQDGGEHYAFTQFQAISARSAFPCFDEPGHKTPFDVSLTVARDHVAVGNTTPEEETPLPGGLKRIRFRRTERLPTYLLAWAVGPLEVVSPPPLPPNDQRNRPLPLRGLAARGKGKELAFALGETRRIVEILERFFGVAYPYEKLDLVAVPDFPFGAMENAGAVTFREALLLVHPERAAAEQRLGTLGTIAHEIAHQWFGDLVTMRWWDDSWLSEAFATFLGTRALLLWNPAYAADQHQLKDTFEAMDDDSLVSARRIRQPVETSHDIRNAFDDITYDKGAAVIAMFERYMGPERFRAGVRKYLTRFAHRTATADDFLGALEEAAGGREVAAPFRSFLLQPGVPRIDVEVRCEGKRAQAWLEQSRYLPVGSRGDRQRLWSVPVCLRYTVQGASRERCALLKDRRTAVELSADGCPAWVHPNAGGSGYYRFTLAPAELRKLLGVLPRLSRREVLALADSVASGFRSRKLSPEDAFGALAPLAKVRDTYVLALVAALLRETRANLVPRELRPRVEAFTRQLLGPALARLVLTPGVSRAGPAADRARLERREVVSALFDTGRDPEVIRRLADRGAELVGFGRNGKLDTKAVEADLADVALASAAERHGAPLVEAAVAHLRQSRDAALRKILLLGLARVTDPALSARVRDLALDPALRANEVFRYLLPAHAKLPENRDATWRWLTERFDRLAARLPPEQLGTTPGLVPFCDEEQARELERFFAPRAQKIAGGPRVLLQSLEAIRLCAKLAAAQGPGTREFFSKD